MNSIVAMLLFKKMMKEVLQMSFRFEDLSSHKILNERHEIDLFGKTQRELSSGMDLNPGDVEGRSEPGTLSTASFTGTLLSTSGSA